MRIPSEIKKSFVVEITGEILETPKDWAIFALKDARRKTGAIRTMQLMNVARFMEAGKLSFSDIGATDEEAQELEKIISRAK